MKSLYIILLSLIATASQAAPIDVITSHKVGGSFYRASASLHDYNPSAFNEVRAMGSCSEVFTTLKNTDKPTIAIWDYLSYELAANPACKFEEDTFITTYVSNYYSICSIDAKYDLDYLLNNSVKMGVADWYTTKEAASQTLKGIGSPSDIVAYGTYKDYTLALEIGEVEYIYTHKPTDKMTCVLSNDPTSTVKHTGDLYDHPFAQFSNNIGILGVNVDKDEVQSLIIDAGTNSDMVKSSSTYKNSFAKQFRGEQLNFYKRLLAVFE